MAKFRADFSENYAYFWGSKSGDEVLGVDDLLEVLRPAAIRLRDAYRDALSTIVHRQSGELADSIEIEDNYSIEAGYVSITVGPHGKRTKSKRKRKSRKGSSSARYAKHNRDTGANAMSNQELAYLLEYGTPRMDARHWLETTNESVEDEVQDIIESGFNDLLKRKGL